MNTAALMPKRVRSVYSVHHGQVYDINSFTLCSTVQTATDAVLEQVEPNTANLLDKEKVYEEINGLQDGQTIEMLEDVYVGKEKVYGG